MTFFKNVKKFKKFIKSKKAEKKNLKLIEDLKKANWENTNNFIPKLTFGKVIKVYDVDSITIVAKPYKDDNISRFSIRLADIDGPELRSQNEREKEAAKKARDILQKKILDEYIYITNVKIDKYGRYLCNIWLNNININEWLLTQNLVVQYSGGKKEGPEDWLDYFENKKND